jgi:hypothetical protein
MRWMFLALALCGHPANAEENLAPFKEVIERAINSIEATFAALPMHLLMGKEGVIARLRASGHDVEEPELLSR